MGRGAISKKALFQPTLLFSRTKKKLKIPVYVILKVPLCKYNMADGRRKSPNQYFKKKRRQIAKAINRSEKLVRNFLKLGKKIGYRK
jgi:hypothetical protein